MLELYIDFVATYAFLPGREVFRVNAIDTFAHSISVVGIATATCRTVQYPKSEWIGAIDDLPARKYPAGIFGVKFVNELKSCRISLRDRVCKIIAMGFIETINIVQHPKSSRIGAVY